MKLAFSYVIAKIQVKIPHRSDILLQKIDNDLIQFLDARYNDLWLFLLPKTRGPGALYRAQEYHCNLVLFFF